jgi:hypothetical protein
MSSIRKTPEHILLAYSLLATDTVAADMVAAAADTAAVGAEAADTAVEAVPEGAAAVEVAATAAATAAAVSGSDLSGSARGEGRSPGSPGKPVGAIIALARSCGAPSIAKRTRTLTEESANVARSARALRCAGAVMAKRGISNNPENLDRCAFYSQAVERYTSPTAGEGQIRPKAA